MLATDHSDATPTWRADIVSRRIFVPIPSADPEEEVKKFGRPLWLRYVILRRTEHEVIPFFVSRRRGKTPTAWNAEVSRLIGTERAEEIVRILAVRFTH
jgi:hypothetical protein